MSFRFEGFEIWQRAGDVAMALLGVADQLEARRLYRFAEQLRAAALSMPNNIAEGSGGSRRDFAHFLTIARRSTYENASMVLLFARKGLIDGPTKDRLARELEELGKMLYAFTETLRRSE